MLREELIEDEKETSEGTWNHIRDAIQTKVPFVIITFKTKESCNLAIQTDLREYNITRQLNIMQRNNAKLKYPSVFFVLNKDFDFKERIKDLFEKYDIRLIIIGTSNAESSQVYFEDGSSSVYGNEVVNALDDNEFNDEDRFKVGGMYYQFVQFKQE